MTENPAVFVHEATLELRSDADPRAVGAEVTRALCGHWEHEGPCRWPHNNDIDLQQHDAVFRTIFVCTAKDESDIRARIQSTIGGDARWRLVSARSRSLQTDERELAERLQRAARL